MTDRPRDVLIGMLRWRGIEYSSMSPAEQAESDDRRQALTVPQMLADLEHVLAEVERGRPRSWLDDWELV